MAVPGTPVVRSTTISPRVLETLDPCVVLMGEMMGKYAPLWVDKGGILSLAQGVVYWEPPSTCQDALLEAISDTSNSILHTYGPAQGIPELTDAIKTKLNKENGFQNHNVMVTVGANQAYVNCVLTCLNDSSKAIVFRPYYFNHVMAIQMTCGDSSVVVGSCSNQGIPDVSWLEETLGENSDIEMVTIVNPGNPTGVSLSKLDVLQPIVDLCEQYSVWLVLDCTYEYFTTPPDHQPLATFPESRHVIHLFSFSKSYSLAGYRCGYLVLHEDCQQLWKNMLKVQDTLPISPPRISQVAALGALRAGPSWVRSRYESLECSRQAILQAIERLPQTMGGSGAMYVMGQLPLNSNNEVRDDVDVSRQLVEMYGVAVIPGTYCGYPGWIRICYANLKPDLLEVAAERLQKGLHAILNLPAREMTNT